MNAAMPMRFTYVAMFATTIGLLGLTNGMAVAGTALGAVLGGWYGYLRTTKTISLGPLWLLLVMTIGALMAPAIDGDRHIVAIFMGIAYGWLGFLSDNLTRYLFCSRVWFHSRPLHQHCHRLRRRICYCSSASVSHKITCREQTKD